MKAKILCFLSSALMALGMVACSGDDEVVPQSNNQTVENKACKITITLSSQTTRTVLNENTTTTDASPWLWESGDQLILSDKDGKYVATLNLESGAGENVADFSGYTEEGISMEYNQANNKYTYRITYIGLGSLDKTNNQYTIDFNNRNVKKDGTVALGPCDAMYANIELTRQDEGTQVVYRNTEETVTMQKIFSVVHFQMCDEFDSTTSPVSTTQLFGLEGTYSGTESYGKIYNKITLKLGTTTTNPVDNFADYIDADKTICATATSLSSPTNPLAFAGIDNNADFYIVMAPGSHIAPIFKRTYNNGVIAYGTPGTGSMTAGYIYRDETDCSKGIDVVFNSETPIEFAVTVHEWGDPGVTIPEISYDRSK